MIMQCRMCVSAAALRPSTGFKLCQWCGQHFFKLVAPRGWAHWQSESESQGARPRRALIGVSQQTKSSKISESAPIFRFKTKAVIAAALLNHACSGKYWSTRHLFQDMGNVCSQLVSHFCESNIANAQISCYLHRPRGLGATRFVRRAWNKRCHRLQREE